MKLNRLILLLFAIFTSLALSSQINSVVGDYPKDLRLPLNIPASIAGSFGEIRSNHFHSGLDYRTNQREGYPIFAVADGYVSRLRVQSGGFGKAVYLAHPNGYTSVYAHLQRFNTRIGQTVKDYQYRRESFEVDFPLISIEIPVKKGDIIGWSGNSGSSGGPHLHFEIRDSKTEETINPQLFGLEVPDQVKPVITSMYLYRLNGNPFSETTKSQYFQVGGSNGNYYLNQRPVINFNGQVGFGVSAFDQQIVGGNKNGIYSIKLLLDGQTIYHAELERFAFEDSRAINSYIDYPALISYKRTIQKSFIEPGNPLTIYRTENNGLVTLGDDEVHQMQYLIKDVKGNTSTLNFEIKRNASASIEENAPAGVKTVRYNDSSFYQTPDLKLAIPKGVLYSDINLKYSTANTLAKSSYSSVHNIHTRASPVHKNYYLWIKPNRAVPPHLLEKTVIVDTRGASHGGTFENGFVKTGPKSFGSFYISVDTIAPVIRPVNIADEKSMSGVNSIVLKISDNLSGIRSFRGTIDGQWVLFDYDAKTATLRHTFEEGLGLGKHLFQITATDMKMNIRTYNATFYK